MELVAITFLKVSGQIDGNAWEQRLYYDFRGRGTPFPSQRTIPSFLIQGGP